MCPCTSENPFVCESRHGRYACSCSCHRRWKAPAPRKPLDEKQAEIERLREQRDQLQSALSSLVALIDANVPRHLEAFKTTVAHAKRVLDSTESEK